ncbi:MAG: hypothetical protein WA208_02760 [Thermoanaerobaculia bacterium]
MKQARMHRNDKGSALLVSLMVMVGLSLLGLGFVAVSETESAISVNERNSIEVLSRAETGVKLVVEWFQDPQWAEDNGLMPPNDGTYPNITIERDPGTEDYGEYKEANRSRFCDRPYKEVAIDRFYGDERRSDIIINSTTGISSGGNDFLADLNEALFGNDDGGRISEIRIYAPPIIGGVLTARTGETVAANGGFFVGGTRYGLCTIKVTAQKLRGTQVVAERSVKVVLSEWPFPGPQGPIQSNASIDTGGNFGVHWGKITAMETLEDSRATTSLPWVNAWDRIHFEHDFQSTTTWRSGMNVVAAQVIHPSAAAITASEDGVTGEIVLAKFAYQAGAVGTTDASEPAWPTTLGDTVTDNGITYTAVQSREYPLTDPTDPALAATVQPVDSYNYLQELVGKAFEDPWFEARARLKITVPAGTSTPQLYPYTGPTVNEIENEKSLFEDQSYSDPVTRMYRQVSFPRIDYDFWKDIALQASATGADGVKYLRWVDTDRFTDGLSTKKFATWVNTDPDLTSPAASGFYFFDTRQGLNPQNGNITQLTPEIKLNNSDANPFQARGFIYLNTVTLNSTGMNGIQGYHNYPGEPYRDIGYRKVDMATKNSWELDASDNYVIEAADNATWNSQDVNENDVFDLYLTPKTFTADGVTYTNYRIPVRWFPGCTITDGVGSDATKCSEPFEPYLNYQYPAESTTVTGGGAPPSLTVTWGSTATSHVTRVKTINTDGTLPNCGSLPAKCTSEKYDRDGGVITLEPIVVGVLYNEGEYTGTGNALYYGSLLINGAVGKAGTADVYFDEALVKGNWADQFRDFPRVFVTAHESDRQ